MQTNLRLVTTILALAPLSGCCGISQSLTALFCGPRKDPWVTQSYDTPQAALATFLGAVARDDKKAIYLTLGHSLKQHLEVGEVEFQLAWEKIKADTPGIHLADQADVTESRRMSATRWLFTLAMNTVPSVVIEVGLSRQDYWSVTTQPDGSDHRQVTGAVVPELKQLFKTRPGDLDTPIEISLPGPNMPGVTPSEFLSATIAREWKINSFRVKQ